MFQDEIPKQEESMWSDFNYSNLDYICQDNRS